jgi:enoyl-CoA hydratase
MIEFEHILLLRNGRILTILLDRPERLNAFNAQLHSELPRAIQFATEDPTSDIILLTGSDRAFSAGGDLAWQQDAADHPETFERTVREAKQIVFGIVR